MAVDLPSGVSGETRRAVLGAAFQATLTITFARKKPGHLLLPGRDLCGEVLVADIGITDAVIADLAVKTFENLPALWLARFPAPSVDTYKYTRGHVGVFSGGPACNGCCADGGDGRGARRGRGSHHAVAGQRVGGQCRAPDLDHPAQDGVARRRARISEGAKTAGADLRSGLGPHEKVGRFALDLLAAVEGAPKTMVIDADGLTSLAKQRDAFFEAARRPGAPAIVLTPHEGEFARLFPDIAVDKKTSKLAKARRAAALSHCTIIFKGPDTVIASPDGRAAINSNGTPLLATAGSGDVLAGIVASLAAQGMPVFEAACAAVWMHAEAATRFGPGLIAEDLPMALLPVLRELHTLADKGRGRS